MVITHIFVGLKTLSFFTNFLGVQRYQGNPTLQPSVDSTVRVVWCVPLHQRRQWCQWVPCAARAQMKVEPELCFPWSNWAVFSSPCLFAVFRDCTTQLINLHPRFSTFLHLTGPRAPHIFICWGTKFTGHHADHTEWQIPPKVIPYVAPWAWPRRVGACRKRRWRFFRVFYGSMFHRFRAPEDTPWGWATQSELWKHPCL